MGKKKETKTHRQKKNTRTTKENKTINGAGQGVERQTEKGEIENQLRNLEWILQRAKAGDVPIYTMDCETDPFVHNQIPAPFAIELFDGINRKVFWGDDCMSRMREHFMDGLEPGIVYMHNGGRFDFFFMLDWFQGDSMIINSRIVRAFMPIDDSKDSKRKYKTRFDFRDSFAILPFALKTYKKDDIEIWKLEKKHREKYKDDILSYLHGDCNYLWELVMQFQQEFGDFKTVASAAFKQLTGFHKYDQLPLKQDAQLRSNFYFGGRVQCFEKGTIKDEVEIYDVNSMYPFVMDTFFHPTGWITAESQELHGWNRDGNFSDEKLKTFFLTVEGENNGAFAIRKEDGSVDFTKARGVFHVSIHEYFAGLQTKRFSLYRILNTLNFNDYTRFHLFVDHFYKAREQAKKSGDKVHALFYKYILNSAYGKFGLNPDNYYNWKITRTSDAPAGKEWELDSINHETYFIWKQPNQLPWNVKNIACAASITGAARSILLRAIALSNRVLYCDTDSIICRKFAGGQIDDAKLGAWKLEGTGSLCAIAGKKMYAVFDRMGTCIKHANKGVKITPEEIVKICNGEEILYMNDAPTFKRDGGATFIERMVKMT